MRRAVPMLAITAAAVVLLARYETTPPRTVNPNAAHQLPRAIAQRPRPAPTPLPPGTRSALGPAMSTPFSLIQVRAFVTHGRLTGVETVALSGDGPHTAALNARAEPILRAEALKAHSADIHVVSGATSTSKIWIASLRGAIRQARRGD